MKLKLLVDWKDPSGQNFVKDAVIELDENKTEEKELISDMLLKDEAVKYVEKTSPDKKEIKNIVTEALKEGLKDFDKKIDEKITTHEKSDDDLSHGYCPEVQGRELTQAEKEYGFGIFCKELAEAGEGCSNPTKRLAKSKDISVKMYEKAAGDGMNVSTPSEGGFLALPPVFNTMLLDRAMEMSNIRQLATTFTIGSETISLPRTKNYDHSSNLIHGGMLAYFEAENAQLSESKPAMEQIQIPLHLLTVLAFASHHMITFSSVTLGSYLVPKMSEALAWREDGVWIDGTGAGQPLGILNSPSIVEVSKETNQAAATVVTDNVLKMFERLRVEKSSSVKWMYNKLDLFYQLSKLVLEVGTGGAPAGLIQRVPGSPDNDMLGVPLVDSEHCEAAGTVGDLILTDWSQYGIVDHTTGPQVAQSIHLKFDYAQNAYRILKFVGGGPLYSAPFTRRKSTNDSAGVVTLAERA